jgi:hypothetical protein
MKLSSRAEPSKSRLRAGGARALVVLATVALPCGCYRSHAIPTDGGPAPDGSFAERSCEDVPPPSGALVCAPDLEVAALCTRCSDGDLVVDVIAGWEPAAPSLSDRIAITENDCAVDGEVVELGPVCASERGGGTTMVSRCSVERAGATGCQLPWMTRSFPAGCRSGRSRCHPPYLSVRNALPVAPTRACVFAAGCDSGYLFFTIPRRVERPNGWSCRLERDGSHLRVELRAPPLSGGSSVIPCALPPLENGTYDVELSTGATMPLTIAEPNGSTTGCFDL